MNWLDIVIALGLIGSTFVGLAQGLIRAVLSLVGVIVGIVIASNFYGQLAGLFTFISNPNIANVVAFAIILVSVLIVAGIAATALRFLVKAVNLGWIDRIAGAVLGFFIGAFFLGAILAAFAKFFGEGPVTSSFLAGFLLDKFPIVLGLLPREFDGVRQFFQ